MPVARIPDRKRACLISSHPMTFSAFLLPHVRELAKKYDVSLVTNLASLPRALSGIEVVEIRDIRIERKVRPILDLKALVRILFFLRAGRFDAVITVAPKSGLLGTAAGFLAGVPVRIHWFTGQVWATKRGLSRGVLRTLDKWIVFFASAVLADSRAQAAFLLREGVVGDGQCHVLADGSISGVDPAIFKPDPAAREAIRGELEISPEEVVTVFLGRINKEKGCIDLANAYAAMSSEHQHRIIWVGADEDRLMSKLSDLLAAAGKKSSFVGMSESPAKYLAAADLLCLPSYREGFGTSVIEGAAVGLPAIVSDAFGLSDTFVDGQTGLLFPVGDRKALTQALEVLHNDPELRITLGEQARNWALTRFPQSLIVQEFAAYVEDQFAPAQATEA